MKKLNLFIFTILASYLSAQPYGQEDYPNSVQLNSGAYTQIVSNGFLMAGLTSSGFHVDKTNDGPAFNGSLPYSFRNDYKIYSFGAACLSTASGFVSNIVGVTAIETQVTNTWMYAVAGAYPDACFLTLLHDQGANDGSFQETLTYPFPYSCSVVEKPYIMQAASGDLFITGRFDTSLYVIKTNSHGQVQWGHFYSCGHVGGPGTGLALDGGIFLPSAIIESPFNGEIIVVGKNQPQASLGRAIEGFIMSLKPATGAVNFFNWIGDNHSKCNWVNAIAPINTNAAGGNGYILVGTSDPFLSTSQNYGIEWIHKVDLLGNTLWDHLYTAMEDPDGGGGLNGVVERVNTSNIHEIYATGSTLGSAAFGMLLYKVDEQGIPYSVTHGGWDESFYSATSTSQLHPVALTCKQNSGFDDGLHIYANHNGNPYLLESYFNGITGCSNENHGNILAYESGHMSMNHWINIFGSFTNCDGLLTSYNATSISPSFVCSNSSVAGGSNLRTAIATGIPGQKNESGVQISPNPSAGEFNINASRAINLKITNELGQQVKTVSLADGASELKINDLPAGIYFINDDANTIKQKLVITK